MTCRRSLAPALALVLAACGTQEKEALPEGAQDAARQATAGQAGVLPEDHALGRARMAAGDLAGAGRAFDRALRSTPADPGLWVDIARLRYRGGEQAQAIAASLHAAELAPGHPGALLLRAQLTRDAQGHGAALPLLERGLAAAPDDADLLAEYAATLGEMGRTRDMLAAVRRLAEAAPGDPRALYLQAVLAARAGKSSLARTLLQRGGGLARDMPAATLLLALIDLDRGNAASAAQGLDFLLARQPDNRRLRHLLAHALAAAGNDRELVARFAHDAPDRATALLVGRAYERLGDRARAAPFLDRGLGPPAGARIVVLPPASLGERASMRNVGDGQAAVARVRQAIGAGRAGEALSLSGDWLRRHPGSADAMMLAGDAALAGGDPRAALGHYRAAAAIRRPWPLAKRMAAAMEAIGRPESAEALVAAHLAGEPGNTEAADLLAQRGQQRRAQALARRPAAIGG